MTTYDDRGRREYGAAIDARVEEVVLLDDRGRAIGAAPKHAVHDRATPLHLAFSCYVFDPQGRLLVTQRALGKRTWPGSWTNTVCGHPAPGEALLTAVRRRAGEELGLRLDDLQVVLPTFRYRAVMPDGVAEHEVCPVLTSHTDDVPTPDPDEVAGLEWVEWHRFCGDVLHGRRAVSPWCLAQVRQLVALGPNPLDWPAAPISALPPAARPD